MNDEIIEDDFVLTEKALQKNNGVVHHILDCLSRHNNEISEIPPEDMCIIIDQVVKKYNESKNKSYLKKMATLTTRLTTRGIYISSSLFLSQISYLFSKPICFASITWLIRMIIYYYITYYKFKI